MPDLPKGRYYLKFVSGWSIWRHEGKFSAISNDFIISPKPCDSQCIDSIPMGKSPDTFSTESAPLELQFMYSHFNGTQQAMSDFIDGVIDTPEMTGRALATAIKSPRLISKTLRNPIKSFKKLMDEWENQFERNPFRATGQAVGAAMEIGASKLIYDSMLHKSKACPGGNCFNRRKPEVVLSIKGIICPICIGPIEKSLKDLGISDYLLTYIPSQSLVDLNLYHDKGKLIDLLITLIDNLGLELVLVK